MSRYVMDQQAAAEPRRLSLLEAWADAGTKRHLLSLGLGEGWHCLEVGAGGGSIARWLAERVGRSGSVLATDLDCRLIEASACPPLEVRRHDVVNDPLPEAAYDLVHARLVLEHLKERRATLQKLAQAVRPGGWLVVEDQDIAGVAVAAAVSEERRDLFMQRIAALVRLLTMAGIDLEYGRDLHGEMGALPLTEIGAEGRVNPVVGGSDLAEFWRLTWEQLRPQLVGFGLLTREQVDEVIELMQDPSFVWTAPTIMAAWGRRAAAT